jgi:PAS domain S-box-containing protein
MKVENHRETERLQDELKRLRRRLAQAESLVEQERSRLKKYFEQIPLPAYNISLDGTILDLNRSALEFLEYENKQDLIGKPLLTTVYAPDSRSKAKILVNRWKREGSLRNEELQVLTREGEIRDVLLNVEMILDQEGKLQHSISVHLDMAGVILLALDKEGKVVLANPKACSVLGGEEGEIIGKDWFESFIPEHERREVWRVFQQLMSGTVEPAEYVENQVLTLGDNVRWVAWHNTLIKSGAGGILGTFSSGEDITERRQTLGEQSPMPTDEPLSCSDTARRNCNRD